MLYFKLPDCYKRAAWWGTTLFDAECGLIGVGFKMADGEVVRVAFDEANAVHVMQTLGEYLERYRKERIQSDTSSGAVSASMLIEVTVESAEDFTKYLQSQPLLVAKEEKVFFRQRWYRGCRRILSRLRALLQHPHLRW